MAFFAQEGETALHLAIKEERIEVVTLLLDNGADIDACNAQVVFPQRNYQRQK